MLSDISPEAPRGARHAFVLGWAYTNLGGVNEVLRNLVREFSRSGRLAPLFIHAGAVTPAHSECADAPVPLLSLDFLPPYDRRQPWLALFRFCAYLLPCLLRLCAICRNYNVEVLNPHFVGLQYFVLVLFKRTGLFRGKLVLSFHGSDVRMILSSRGLERFLCKLLLRGADYLIPCSHGLAEELLMFVPECAGRVLPVHNGIDVVRFRASADPAFRLPESFAQRTKLLSVGAFEYKKAHEVLLRSFARLRQTRNDICLILAGQRGHALRATEALIRELDLADDVLILRDLPHPQIAALMCLADVFVLSSRWQKGVCGEGFAMVLLEAAAAGLPVVSTESCGVSELIKNGTSGLVVPTERPDLLAEAIEFFLQNPEEAARQADNLHNVVRERFTWAEAHARYLQLASGVVDSRALNTRGTLATDLVGDLLPTTSVVIPVAPSHDG